VLSFKTCSVSIDFVPSSILSSYLGYLAIFWVILINFIFVFFRSILVQTIVRFVISSLNQCSSSYKLYSCLRLLLVFSPYLCHVFTNGEGTKEDCRSTMQKTKPWFEGFRREVDKCRRLFYDLQASWENEVQRQKNERRRRAAVVIIQKYVRKWLVRCAYLKFLSITTSIQCCWRKVLAIREFRRLNKRLLKSLLILFKIRGRIFLKREWMIRFSLVIRPK